MYVNVYRSVPIFLSIVALVCISLVIGFVNLLIICKIFQLFQV